MIDSLHKYYYTVYRTYEQIHNIGIQLLSVPLNDMVYYQKENIWHISQTLFSNIFYSDFFFSFHFCISLMKYFLDKCFFLLVHFHSSEAKSLLHLLDLILVFPWSHRLYSFFFNYHSLSYHQKAHYYLQNLFLFVILSYFLFFLGDILLS